MILERKICRLNTKTQTLTPMPLTRFFCYFLTYWKQTCRTLFVTLIELTNWFITHGLYAYYQLNIYIETNIEILKHSVPVMFIGLRQLGGWIEKHSHKHEHTKNNIMW